MFKLMQSLEVFYFNYQKDDGEERQMERWCLCNELQFEVEKVVHPQQRHDERDHTVIISIWHFPRLLGMTARIRHEDRKLPISASQGADGVIDLSETSIPSDI
jgi:hypothetical protein